ncbi:MAG: hypothetical protein Kow0069_18460 [Promethearchaeota archaeon]
MVVIGVTGAGSTLARVVLPGLARMEGVEKVACMDVRPLHLEKCGLVEVEIEWRRADVRY